MSEYRLTVGLEVHAELRTETKMFCACRNAPDERAPNVHVCPVCLAHPGTLPVINKQAVHNVLRMGVAMDGTLADYTEFDRKNYFYPDIPKGYQISQYQHPLVRGGTLAGVALTRVHLEEDTARSQHTLGKGTSEGEKSLVDYNRAGVPLLELVTEPVIHSAEDAGRFARELQLLLRSVGAGEANMEKGEMRLEANISVSKDGTLGTKVEVKNINSFRSVERAIAFEAARQSAALEKGEVIVQETRGWDEAAQKTFSQRKKESSHDYRYFPDPDLPKLVLSELPECSAAALRAGLPELPAAKRARLQALGILQNQDIAQLVEDAVLSDFFSKVETELDTPELLKTAANFILNDIAGERKKNPDWMPQAAHVVAVVRAYQSGALASPQAKSSILSGTMASVTAAETLPALVAGIIDAHPQVVADYKAGKGAALQFLIGQGMKESKGSANPQALREAIQKILG